MKKSELMKRLLDNYDNKEGHTIVDTVNGIEYTLPELFVRQYLNNGCDGLNMRNVVEMYEFIVDNKEHFIKHNMIGEQAYNDFGLPLWDNFDI